MLVLFVATAIPASAQRNRGDAPQRNAPARQAQAPAQRMAPRQNAGAYRAPTVVAPRQNVGAFRAPAPRRNNQLVYRPPITPTMQNQPVTRQSQLRQSQSTAAISQPRVASSTTPHYGGRSNERRNGSYDSFRYHGGRGWCHNDFGWHPLILLNGGWGYWYVGVWNPYPYPYAYGYLTEPLYVNNAEWSSGMKFDLDGIPKDNRDFVKQGTVYVDSAEVGSVKNFEGYFRMLSLQEGSHEVNVVLSDGRSLTTTVSIQYGRVTHMNLRLDRFFEPAPSSSETNVPEGQ